MTLDIILNSLYIVVENMDRAINFYDNWVLEFKDTEGNDIEIYSKIN